MWRDVSGGVRGRSNGDGLWCPLTTSSIQLLCNHSSHSLEECDFCGLKGHTLSQCHKLIAACAYACRPHNPKKQTTNTELEVSNIIKSAGNASSCHISSSPLQINANFNWNTDSGTTSHMTPHSHWMHNYTLFQTPIHLANNHIVYSAGVGSVGFIPMIGGKKGRAVEFTQVLHVPEISTYPSCT